MTFIPGQASLNNVDDKDIAAIEYSATGLGAQTLTWETDGRTFREYFLDVRYTAGGTLALSVNTSGEDVASGSVSTWQPSTKTLIDQNTGAIIATATVTASGSYRIRIEARWVQISAVLTGTGNSLAFELWKGWG
jgi:hypothetical protein